MIDETQIENFVLGRDVGKMSRGYQSRANFEVRGVIASDFIGGLTPSMQRHPLADKEIGMTAVQTKWYWPFATVVTLSEIEIVRERGFVV